MSDLRERLGCPGPDGSWIDDCQPVGPLPIGVGCERARQNVATATALGTAISVAIRATTRRRRSVTLMFSVFSKENGLEDDPPSAI